MNQTLVREIRHPFSFLRIGMILLYPIYFPQIKKERALKIICRIPLKEKKDDFPQFGISSKKDEQLLISFYYYNFSPLVAITSLYQ